MKKNKEFLKNLEEKTDVRFFEEMKYHFTSLVF